MAASMLDVQTQQQMETELLAQPSSMATHEDSKSPGGEATSFPQGSESGGQSRLEALIEQQNALLFRQLQVAEKSQEKLASAAFQRNAPQDLLKSLDPAVKAIFQQWRKQLVSTVAIYVAQSRKYSKLQASSSQGELVQPFSGEARRTWDWPQCYRLIAQPLQDSSLSQVDDSSGTAHSNQFAETPDTFDIDQAFGELRRKHALDLQNFVLGHQKACVDSLADELALDRQTSKLHEQLAVLGQSQVYTSDARQTLELQAKTFVKAVHRIEMQAAEKKIKDEFVCPRGVQLGLRIALVMALISAIVTMNQELLMRAFAIFFALGCGMALLWEDLVVLGARFLLGQSLKRFESLRAQASQVDVNLPIAFWQ